jgi:N-acetylglucosaminyldiphosphoundecaprenol N-acetyl-beta-D-mannosaminyltransferase
MRVELLGSPVDILSARETIQCIDESIAKRVRLQHVALNVAKLVALRTNSELREDVISSNIVGIDGMGIVLALKVMGHRNVPRVSGVDLLCDSLSLCANRGYHPFFLGAEKSVVKAAVQTAREKYPGLVFAGVRDGYFSEAQEDAVREEIQASHADCLFIGMPTPRKERLLAKWRGKLDVPFIMGVGGSFDVLAGKVQRAPLWMQQSGLEWAYRVYQEPRRMWWRYARTNAVFLGLLFKIAVRRLIQIREVSSG